MLNLGRPLLLLRNFNPNFKSIRRKNRSHTIISVQFLLILIMQNMALFYRASWNMKVSHMHANTMGPPVVTAQVKELIKGTQVKYKYWYLFFYSSCHLFIWLSVAPICSTFKTRCKARIRFKTKDSKLVVTAISAEHNHTISSNYSDCYPENRRLNQEEADQAAVLMDLEVAPVILQNVVRTATSKCVSQQDLRNVK